MSNGDDIPFDVRTWTGYETRYETHRFTASQIENATSLEQLEMLLDIQQEYEDEISRVGLQHVRGRPTIDGTERPNQDDIDTLEEQKQNTIASINMKYESYLGLASEGVNWRDIPDEPEASVLNADFAEAVGEVPADVQTQIDLDELERSDPTTLNPSDYLGATTLDEGNQGVTDEDLNILTDAFVASNDNTIDVADVEDDIKDLQDEYDYDGVSENSHSEMDGDLDGSNDNMDID